MRRREGKVGGMEGGLEQGASYHIGSHYHRIIKTHSGAEINCGEGFLVRVLKGVAKGARLVLLYCWVVIVLELVLGVGGVWFCFFNALRSSSGRNKSNKSSPELRGMRAVRCYAAVKTHRRRSADTSNEYYSNCPLWLWLSG